MPGQNTAAIKNRDSSQIKHVKHGRFDRTLLIVVGLLLPVGVIMVYSASNAVALEFRGDSYYFFKMQLLWCCTGLMGMLFAAFFNYRRYQRIVPLLLLVSGVLLALVYVPGLGVEIGGGRRWIRIWKLSFQPVEFAKLTLTICIARLLDKNIDHIKSFWRGVVPCLLILLFFLALIYKQPDFGSLIIMGILVFVMMFVGGASIFQIILLGGTACLLASALVIREPYRLIRLKAFWDPWQDPEGAGYHIIQSFYALGVGGILGKGIGHGIQKLHYLPTPHSDFIFAVIGEELGFVGSIFIISLFMVILWRGIHISLTTRNRFGSLLAFGISSLIGIHAIINIGVVTGTLPTKGLTLPFISSGGSSMLMSLVSVGILLNIRRRDSLDIEEQW